ncbi:MAG: LamG domain-containing protein [Myxococcota bacterium]
MKSAHACNERKSPRLRGIGLALGIAFVVAGATACGDYGGGSPGSGGSSSSGSTLPGGGGGSAPDPAQSIPAFETTVLPILQAQCASCHAGSGPGTPAIAHADTATAYYASMNNQKVNLGNPLASRLVQRLAVDLHYCWGVCTVNAEEMRAAIADWATQISYTGAGVDPGTIRTSQQMMADGVELDSSDERYANNLIALWEFKEGTGTTVADTSGMAPAIDLTLEGADVSWLPSYGIDIVDGRAIAGPATSRKLYDRIAAPGTGTQQYTVEAWIVPANIDQGDNTPRIISYSQNTSSRNFTLGQVFYQYAFRNRNTSANISTNGTPDLITYDMDRDAQATLQHVVLTYSLGAGRRIYVDGLFTDDVDPVEAQPMWNWASDYSFLLGNERTNNRQWKGKIQLVAIYDQALTPQQINQNYLAGVGRKVVLRFDVSQWAGPGAYLEFLVSELDSNSYLFCQPVFYANAANGLRIAGLRIAVNGVMPVNGQAFANVDAASFGQPTQISRLCSVIAQDQGAGLDVFEIDIEIVDGYEHDFVETVTPAGVDTSVLPPVPAEGLRNFELVNASMATLTGVSPATPAVQSQFVALQEQLPAGFDLRTFVSSNQMGISKLALEYCDELVEDPVARDAFFGPGSTFAFDAPVATAFAGANADLVVDPIVDKMMGVGIPNQPSTAGVKAEVHALISSLNASCTVCDAQRTKDTVKAACTAVLGSAVVTLH